MAASAFPYFVKASALGRGGVPPPSGRVTIGCIGVGNMGFWHLKSFLGFSDVQVLAVCDVFANKRDRAKGEIERRYGNADSKAYNDYRELIARSDIDAVYIAAPDHWHALMTIDAAKAGKHVYCQKPLTRTFAEGLAVRNAVQNHRVVFQHGTQQRSDARMVFGCELVLNGRIGKLTRVKLSIPSGRQIPPQRVEPVPEGFDYDMWLGPAPWAPYTSKRCSCEEQNWYFISDYCIGYLAGQGVHAFDSAQQGSGMDHTGPVEIKGIATFPTDGLYDTALTWNIEYTFANGLVWECLDFTQERFKQFGSPQYGGILFEGTNGWVFIWRNQVEAEPKSLLREVIGPEEIHLHTSSDHERDFIECIKSGLPTVAPVDVALRSTTYCYLADIATRLARKIKWDPINQWIVGDDEATRMLSRSYREPWRL
jgi:predicted dehydrogenase